MITMTRRIGLVASAAAFAITLAAAAAPSVAAQPSPAEVDRAGFALVAKITIKPGQTGRFIEAMKAQVSASRAEPGVVAFNVLQSSADPLVFYSFESYRDRAAFEAHVKTADTAKILGVLKEVQARDLEAQFLQPLP